MPSIDFKNFLWKLLPIVLLLTLICGKYFLFPDHSLNKNNKRLYEEKLLTDIFIKATYKIKDRWEFGDLENNFSKKKFECPEDIYSPSPFVDEQYFRCNPNYLQCYFSGKTGIKNPHIPIVIEDKTYHVSLKENNDHRLYKVISPPYGIILKMSIEEFPSYSMEIFLEDTCHDTYLPQRIYSYGLAKNSKEWIWDNFNQDIYVDKFLVTYRDIMEWKKYKSENENENKNKKNLEIPNQPTQYWFYPASGLTLEQMKEFCAFRGKQLLMAPIFDASTFYPDDINNPRPEKIQKRPYPWSKQNHLNHHENLPSRQQCRLIYSKDCVPLFPREFYKSHDSSWIEVNQILGGSFEAFYNPIDPQLNIKASSQYFPSLSSWHQLGLRTYWDGKGFKNENFNFSDLFEDSYEVGFRCMIFGEGEGKQDENENENENEDQDEDLKSDL